MEITQNWADAINKGTALIAPGEEGIKGLMISNAIFAFYLDRQLGRSAD